VKVNYTIESISILGSCQHSR